MKESDRLELIRISELNHVNPEYNVNHTIELLNKEMFLYQNNLIKQYDLLSSSLFFLASGFKSYYLTKGVLNKSTSDLLFGCYLYGRIKYYSNYFGQKAGIYNTVYLWDLLFSILANDKKCIDSYYRLFNNPSNYMYEVRAIENGLREIILQQKNIDLKNHEIFTRTSKTKFFESAIQLVRDCLRKDEEGFKRDSVDLLTNYRRWATSNNKYEEISIPIIPLALIRFGHDYCNFELPNLYFKDDYAISDFREILTENYDSNLINDSSSLWPELFSIIDCLSNEIEIENIINKKRQLPTHVIVHAGFSAFRKFVTRKKS